MVKTYPHRLKMVAANSGKLSSAKNARFRLPASEIVDVSFFTLSGLLAGNKIPGVDPRHIVTSFDDSIEDITSPFFTHQSGGQRSGQTLDPICPACRS